MAETPKGWPNLPENQEVNEVLGALTDQQRNVLAQLLQRSRDGGIHDVLAYLNEAIGRKDLRLVTPRGELPVEPFGTELHYDWTCRREGRRR